MSRTITTIISIALLASAFTAGWIAAERTSHAEPHGNPEGKYVWDHDKSFIGMDQELEIRGDSGYITIPEVPQEAFRFSIEGDTFVMNDTVSLPFYLSDEGLGIIWPGGTHQMWRSID